MYYICTRNNEIMAHGVMVTLLFLVQSFKVRVLVSQQKILLQKSGIFLFSQSWCENNLRVTVKKNPVPNKNWNGILVFNSVNLYFKSNNWSFCMVY